MQPSLRSMLIVAGLVAGLAVPPASPWGMPTPMAAAQPAPAAGETRPNVISARIGLHPDKTRFVLEVSERVTFQTAVLESPNRVVIDLPNMAWPGGEASNSGRGVVRGYHAERTPTGALRVVLEVSEPVHLGSVFVMPPSEGYRPRLVFDLVPTAAGAPPADPSRNHAAAAVKPTPAPSHTTPPAAAPSAAPPPPAATPAQPPPPSWPRAPRPAFRPVCNPAPPPSRRRCRWRWLRR